MVLLQFYRFYVSLACGAAFYLGLIHSIWLALLVILAVRISWFAIERWLESMRIRRAFNTCIADFRQHYGPYGIRLANKAETDGRVKRSLVEAFEPDPGKLKKTVEQLEVMDTLFKAGMRPDGDEYLLHDLKLKYARYRLEKNKPA